MEFAFLQSLCSKMEVWIIVKEGDHGEERYHQIYLVKRKDNNYSSTAKVAGSYICSDTNCPSVADFELNRTDFAERNGAAVCDICGSVARYIRCDARLITERELKRNTVTAEFVVKSSRLKVNFLLNLDRSGSHPLSSETVHLDAIHSKCKMWKTYTVSFYCKLLREMVKLVTMECKKECAVNCRLFFMQVNKMIRDQSGDAHLCFNPHHIKDDEHGGNKIGIADVLGVDALSRTTSCVSTMTAAPKSIRNLLESVTGSCIRKLH